MERFSLVTLDSWLLRQVLAVTGQPPIRFVAQSGAQALPDDGDYLATVRFHSRGTLLRLILDPDTGFGDGFSAGEITVDGDLVGALAATFRAMNLRQRRGWLSGVVSAGLAALQPRDVRASSRNARHHYDRGEDFYSHWLDRQMLYTCAYYPVPGLTLEQAQIAKMDHVCRKLQLRKGERVVEAGCGWGALALFMARHHGVEVKAFNVSREQVRYARRRAREEGLERNVEFIEDDYRNIRGCYDAFVSVGMLEHVGPEHYADLGRVIHHAIGRRGRGLLHFIGRSHAEPLSTWIRERIFPAAYPPTVGESARVLEYADYAILDVENLRPHYEKTLNEWLSRFEDAMPALRKVESEDFLRAWRLYLAGSVAGFRVGALQLFQVTFAGQDYLDIPWTREHLYTQRAIHLQTSTRSKEPWMAAMS